MSTRLDVRLVADGAFGGRDTAKRHIEAGEVTVNGRVVTKASFGVEPRDVVQCDVQERYVGRGGYKLERAIQVAGLNLDGVVAMDVGASTGGFTDCMLQHGAVLVYAIDVGHGQLHGKLREDPAVVCLENTDIRSPDMATRLEHAPSFCSIDVSFISLKQVLPAVLPLLCDNAMLVCLIKPQFEAGRSAVGKNGVVKDAAAHVMVLRDLMVTFSSMDCGLLHLVPSPIRGGEGNIEYLAVLGRGKTGEYVDIKSLVNEAFKSL